MAGKNTSARGLHSSRQGHIASEFGLDNNGKETTVRSDLVRKLSEIIGRELEEQESNEIFDVMTTFKDMRKMYFEGVSSRQDIKRTLSFIAQSSPENALVAFENCDELTRGIIERTIYVETDNGFSAEIIPSAARIALQNISNLTSTGGAPKKYYQADFAEYCVNLWIKVGGKSTALWRKGESDELSPLLLWAVVLFSSLEGNAFDWKRAWELLSHEISRGKVSTL